jgi:hypothetical protein
MNKRLAKLKNIQEANILFTKRNLKENEFSLDDLFSKKIQSNMDEDDEFNDNQFPMEEDDEFSTYGDDEFNYDEFSRYGDDEFNDRENPKSVHDSDMNESSSKRKCLSCGKKR